jgi:hypothetical protein
VDRRSFRGAGARACSGGIERHRHLDAGPADAERPPSVRIGAPFQYLPTRDPRQSHEEYAATLRHQRVCPTLLMSGGTNAELLHQSVEVLCVELKRSASWWLVGCWR